MENLAYDYMPESLLEESDFEIIGGEKFIMAIPSVNHNLIISRLIMPIMNYIDKHNIEAIVLSGVVYTPAPNSLAIFCLLLNGEMPSFATFLPFVVP